MMVDDLDNLSVLDASCCLADFVVVDKDDLAVRVHGDVGPRDDANRHVAFIEHDGLTERTFHDVGHSLFELVFSIEREDLRFHDGVDRLVERCDEVRRNRHLRRALGFEDISRRNVAVGDHARRDEALVRAVLVRDDERLHVVLAQDAPGFDDLRICFDRERIGCHDVGHASEQVVDDHGHIDAPLVEYAGRFARQRAEARRYVRGDFLAFFRVAPSQLVLEPCVADSCADRVIVRILVSYHDDG